MTVSNTLFLTMFFFFRDSWYHACHVSYTMKYCSGMADLTLTTLGCYLVCLNGQVDSDQYENLRVTFLRPKSAPKEPRGSERGLLSDPWLYPLLVAFCYLTVQFAHSNCALPYAVNNMIADAMGLFPRLCSDLSDIVFQKTKGNPFFVLELLRSLCEGGLLLYDVCQRRWTWDERAIRSLDVSNNVLFLLAQKMASLSEETLSTLKVLLQTYTQFLFP